MPPALTKTPYDVFKEQALRQMKKQHDMQLEQLKTIQRSQRDELVSMLDATSANQMVPMTVLPGSMPLNNPPIQRSNPAINPLLTPSEALVPSIPALALAQTQPSLSVPTQPPLFALAPESPPPPTHTLFSYPSKPPTAAAITQQPPPPLISDSFGSVDSVPTATAIPVVSADASDFGMFKALATATSSLEGNEHDSKFNYSWAKKVRACEKSFSRAKERVTPMIYIVKSP